MAEVKFELKTTGAPETVSAFNSIKNAALDMSGGVDKFGHSCDIAAGKVSDFVKGLATWEAIRRVGQWLGELSDSFLSAADTSEQYQTRLSVLLRSQDEGARLFRDMAVYAGKVPFEYEQIMGAATQLAGVMKGGVDEIGQWMPMIGDLAAASGLSIQETTGQVIRMYSAGAGAADLFRERGVLAMLGFKGGVEYTAEETRQKMMDAWTKADSQFRGATDSLAGTWQGLMSMLKDQWFKFRSQVMESGSFNALKSIFSDIKSWADDAFSSGKAKEWVDNLAGLFTGVMTGARLLMETITPLWEALGSFPSGVIEYFQNLTVEMKNMESAAKDLAGTITKQTPWQAFTGFLSKWGEDILHVFEFVGSFAGNTIASMISHVVTGVTALAGYLQSVGTMMAGVLTFNPSLIKAGWEGFTSVSRQALSELSAQQTAYVTSVSGAWNRLEKKMLDIPDLVEPAERKISAGMKNVAAEADSSTESLKKVRDIFAEWEAKAAQLSPDLDDVTKKIISQWQATEKLIEELKKVQDLSKDDRAKAIASAYSRFDETVGFIRATEEKKNAIKSFDQAQAKSLKYLEAEKKEYESLLKSANDYRSTLVSAYNDATSKAQEYYAEAKKIDDLITHGNEFLAGLHAPALSAADQMAADKQSVIDKISAAWLGSDYSKVESAMKAVEDFISKYKNTKDLLGFSTDFTSLEDEYKGLLTKLGYMKDQNEAAGDAWTKTAEEQIAAIKSVDDWIEYLNGEISKTDSLLSQVKELKVETSAAVSDIDKVKSKLEELTGQTWTIKLQTSASSASSASSDLSNTGLTVSDTATSAVDSASTAATSTTAASSSEVSDNGVTVTVIPKASYASGTSYVPADGYYQLHRGEKVLNRSEAAQSSGGHSFSFGDMHFNISAPDGKVDTDALSRELTAKIERNLRRNIRNA